MSQPEQFDVLTVAEHVPRISGKQHNVADLQLQRPAPSRIFQYRRSADNRMIRDLVDLAGSLIDTPGRAIRAAKIEPAAHRHHLKKSAEPIHGGAEP
jgi:hypothetical protein